MSIEVPEVASSWMVAEQLKVSQESIGRYRNQKRFNTETVTGIEDSR